MRLKQRVYMPAIGCLLLLAALPAQANEKVYKSAIPSTAWIISPKTPGVYARDVAAGTAVVVDETYRLLATAYHVVGDRDEVLVTFPKFDKDGFPLREKSDYITMFKNSGIVGKVVSRNSKLDLALIQLPRLPATAKAVKLAPAMGRPGQTIYAIGNSGMGDDVLWRFSSGMVRQACKACESGIRIGEGDDLTIQAVKADMLETQLPINGGDSGGPALNEAGELIGIVSNRSSTDTLVSYVIDAGELGRMVSSYRLDQLLLRPLPHPVIHADLNSYPPYCRPSLLSNTPATQPTPGLQGLTPMPSPFDPNYPKFDPYRGMGFNLPKPIPFVMPEPTPWWKETGMIKVYVIIGILVLGGIFKK